MLNYTKYRWKKVLWMAVVGGGTALNSVPVHWSAKLAGIIIAIAGAAEYGVTREDWRYRDVAKYLKDNGYI